MVSALKSAPPTGEVEGGAQTLNQQQSDRSRYFVQRPDRIEEIKARLDVRDVARMVGVRVPDKDSEKFSSPCPLCFKVIYGQAVPDESCSVIGSPFFNRR